MDTTPHTYLCVCMICKAETSDSKFMPSTKGEWHKTVCPRYRKKNNTHNTTNVNNTNK